MQEKREFIRVGTYNELSYSILPSSKSKHRITKDLSRDGVCFLADHFIPKDSLLKLEIKFQDVPKTLTVIARVVRVRALFDDEHYEVGARFIKIGQEERKYLNYYIGCRIL